MQPGNGRDTLAAVGGHFELAAAVPYRPLFGIPGEDAASTVAGGAGQDSVAAPGQVVNLQDAALITAAVNACTEGVYDARQGLPKTYPSVLLARVGIDQADGNVTKHIYGLYCGGWEIGHLTVDAAGAR